MPSADEAARADVCLVLEGTYPYVKGGVSTWVHDLIGGLPDLRFNVVHIGPGRGAYARSHYVLPANVVDLSDLYCQEPLTRGHDLAALQWAARRERRRHGGARRVSRVLRAIRALHLEERADEALLDDLASGDLPLAALLHGRAAFELMVELCEQLAPKASFLDFFWHFRSMHLPLVHLIGTPPPEAAMYHSVCTGYAGLLAAAWSRRTGRPLLLSEHGIYVRERNLELDRASWLNHAHDRARADDIPGALESPTASALRRMWARFFRTLARIAYGQATTVVSLCDASRDRQIADGAAAAKTLVVPNGIDLDAFHERMGRAGPATPRRVTIGFVGRVVPIKDIITFIRACYLARTAVDVDARVFGTIDEDPQYARRCRRLVAKLGLEQMIRFEASKPIERIYPEIDVVVLTSLSEGQPLVILEAGAAGIPVVASDVGACRELIEGRGEEDRRLGPSGIMTRLAAPEETAAAIVRLARDRELRRQMGAAGRRRVAAYYRESATLALYRGLYTGEPWPASAGASSA